MENQKYAAPYGYPPVKVCRQNPAYAKMMLDNVGGLNSEMTAVSLYFYNHLVLDEYKDAAEAFKRISVVEMHHLAIFGHLSMQLGEDPRLWTQCGCRKKYWSPSYNNYPVCICPLLKNALSGELAAIRKYEAQCRCIEDKGITDCIRRIIEDEKIHVEIFEKLAQKYGCDLCMHH